MKIDVVHHGKIYMSVSAVAILLSLVLLMTNGLNLGIDFEGGTLLERGIPGKVSVADVEAVMAGPELEPFGFGRSFVQPLEDESVNETIFLIRTRSFTGSEPLRAVDEALASRFGDVTVRRTEVVGPVIGQELQRQALWALIISSLGILVYIWLRFEYRFGVIAVLALMHDVIVVLGVLALLGVEVNTSFVAAILTVVGYSINDTIVVFDRIREHLQQRRRRSLPELVNASVNETLGRSINTSLTTLFVVVSLFLFGGTTIRDFTLTLLVGILAGTYSSVFVASPLWLLWRQRKQQRPVQAGSA